MLQQYREYLKIEPKENEGLLTPLLKEKKNTYGSEIIMSKLYLNTPAPTVDSSQPGINFY